MEHWIFGRLDIWPSYGYLEDFGRLFLEDELECLLI